MEIFLAGTAVALNIPLKDAAGNPLSVTSAEYRVVNQNGVELNAKTQVAGFVAGSESVTVNVPAGLNSVAPIDAASIGVDALDSFFVRESRTVELYLKDAADNVKVLTESYALEPAESLIVGLNSFQTIGQAELLALNMPQLVGWTTASVADKIAALVEARLQICQLRFVGIRQDSQNYLVESSDIGDLSLVTPSQFASLSPRFKMALCRAQVAQANSVLGGDPADQKRQDGIVLDTIGESKQMFRSGKPLDLPVSKRALRYLSGFISFSQRIGRG